MLIVLAILLLLSGSSHSDSFKLTKVLPASLYRIVAQMIECLDQTFDRLTEFLDYFLLCGSSLRALPTPKAYNKSYGWKRSVAAIWGDS